MLELAALAKKKAHDYVLEIMEGRSEEIHIAGSQTYAKYPSDYDFVIEYSPALEEYLRNYFSDKKVNFISVDYGAVLEESMDVKTDTIPNGNTIIAFRFVKYDKECGDLLDIDIILVQDVSLWQRFYALYKSYDLEIKIKSKFDENQRAVICRMLYDFARKEKYLEERIFRLQEEKLRSR